MLIPFTGKKKHSRTVGKLVLAWHFGGACMPSSEPAPSVPLAFSTPWWSAILQASCSARVNLSVTRTCSSSTVTSPAAVAEGFCLFEGWICWVTQRRLCHFLSYTWWRNSVATKVDCLLVLAEDPPTKNDFSPVYNKLLSFSRAAAQWIGFVQGQTAESLLPFLPGKRWDILLW